MAAIYSNTLAKFVRTNADELLGILSKGLTALGFDTTPATLASWREEIGHLQEAFLGTVNQRPAAADWPVLLEYGIPIIGQRIDCVVLADDLVLVIEYKGGDPLAPMAALRQAQDYALNLLDFHEESRGRTVIPIAVGEFKKTLGLQRPEIGAITSPRCLGGVISHALAMWGGKGPKLELNKWDKARYFPIPSIIHAATSIFHDHDISELKSNQAGRENILSTETAILDAVKDAIARGVKKLIIVTGVPGSGKTLVGLNAIQALQKNLNLDKEQAAFLSGNLPLVQVLQESLKRSAERQGKKARAVKSRVRDIHRFARETYEDDKPPADRLIVFDEAQRAWTRERNKKKFGLDVAEPEMILEIMSRHPGWAVVIALVGGGQEIHSGEAGLVAWGDAAKKFNDWELISSPEAIVGGPSVAGSRLFRPGSARSSRLTEKPGLHLSISKRSYMSVVTAQWVNAVLEGDSTAAQKASTGGIPILLSRDLGAVRQWLRAKLVGHTRAGLVASSGAARLRADGVEPPTFTFRGGIDTVKWFLEPYGDYQSSNQLEVALSEFELQGLELDYVALLWGGDLIFPEGRPSARTLRTKGWAVAIGSGDPHACADDRMVQILNKYRVLLTRFRKGMVIFVPRGIPDDPTCTPEDFDCVYSYLKICGAGELQTDK